MATVSRSMLARIAAALIGGYIFTTVFSLLVFFIFADFQLLDTQTQQVNPLAVQSVITIAKWSELLSFVFYTAAAMWVFHTRSIKRAWAGMLLPSAVGLGFVYMLLPPNLLHSISSIMELLAVV